MQKWVSNIVILIILLSATSIFAQSETDLLGRADSLYNRKKYAEAQQIYYQLFQKRFSSPSTLLKMAFVYEGLEDTPKALFFLTQYYNQTEDPKAYDKIQVLTNARNLKGYEWTDLDRLLMWIGNRSTGIVLMLLIAAIVSALLMLTGRIMKWPGIKATFGSLSISLLCITLLLVNFGKPTKKGIIARPTYLMTGPSPGANFMTILDGGNQVPVLDSQDVWVKIYWNDKVGYIKGSDLLMN